MKRLLFLVVFITLAMSSMAQNVDADRVNIRKNFTMPLLDTIAAALKIGEERTRPQDSLVWYWQGLRWVNLRGVVSVKDTIPLFHIGAGAPALRPIYAINGALRASNWGSGYGWVPRLLGDSTMVGDVDTTSIAYKQWVINQFSPGGAFSVIFNNAITLTGSTAQWGGILIQNTTITQNAFKTTFGATGTNIITANLSGVNSGVSSAVTINNPQTNSGFSSNYGMQSTAQNGGALTVGGSFVALIGTGAGSAMGIISRGDTYGVQGTGNIGIIGFPTAGSGQAGIKGDGSPNTVYGVWGVGNAGVFGQGIAGSNAIGVYGQSPLGWGVVAENQDPANNTVTTALQVTRGLAPVPAVGLGISIDYSYQTNTLGSGSGVQNRMISKWTNATNGSQSSQWLLYGVTAGAALAPWMDINGITANFYGTGVAISAINSGTGIFTLGTNAGGVFESPAVAVQAANTSTSTNTVVTTFLSSRQGSSYLGAIGSGTRIAFDAHDNAGSITQAGYIQNIVTNAVPANFTTQYKWTLALNGSLPDVMILDGNGNLTTTGGLIIRAPLLTAAGTYTILANDYEVVATGTTSTWTLPAHVAGRSLRLVNQGSGAITIAGGPIRTDNVTTVTTIAAGANFNVDDDGTTYRKTN